MAETAEPNAVGGSIANIIIFSTTPTAADGINPIVFIIVVIIKNDILTKASCNASGDPTINICLIGSLSNLKSLILILNSNFFLTIYTSAKIKLIAWDEIVAIAAPTAPILNIPTNTISTIILIIHAISTK